MPVGCGESGPVGVVAKKMTVTCERVKAKVGMRHTLLRLTIFEPVGTRTRKSWLLIGSGRLLTDRWSEFSDSGSFWFVKRFSRW